MFLQVITVVGGMSICFVLSQMQETFERERKKTSSAQLTLPEYLGFVRDDRRRDLGGRGGGRWRWADGASGISCSQGPGKLLARLWKGREGPGDATGSFLKHLVESF